MNRNFVVGIVLGLLIIISAVQAVQLSFIMGKLGDAPQMQKTSGVVTTSTERTSNNPPAALPSSLDQLDTMVGGC